MWECVRKRTGTRSMDLKTKSADLEMGANINLRLLNFWKSKTFLVIRIEFRRKELCIYTVFFSRAKIIGSKSLKKIHNGFYEVETGIFSRYNPRWENNQNSYFDKLVVRTIKFTLIHHANFTVSSNPSMGSSKL